MGKGRKWGCRQGGVDERHKTREAPDGRWKMEAEPKTMRKLELEHGPGAKPRAWW